MKPYEATESAYKNGYEKGYADGVKVASSSKYLASKWIPVTERLPEKPGYYLTYWHGHSRPEGRVDVLNFDGTVFPWTTLWKAVKNEVTHWMPLPQPPEGE